MVVQYRVKNVQRSIVLRYEGDDGGGSVVERGTYASEHMAYEVAYALCKLEHERSGLPEDDMSFIYPEHVLEPGDK